MPTMPVFLLGGDYWKGFDKMIGKMISLKLISASDTGIFTITDNPMEVVKAANKIGHPKVSENYYDGFREASKIMKMAEPNRPNLSNSNGPNT